MFQSHLETDGGREILAAFEGEIAPVRVAMLYRGGLFIVALAMVFLPLIYVTLIAGAAYGVGYHAVHHTMILSRAGIGQLVIYLTPIVAGGVLVLFMIKPLFTPLQKPAPPMALSQEKQALLFGFVTRICAIVRAPVPRRIHVNCEVNASASFARGWASLWTNDLALTIGMPLVHGMRMNELAGVFAHEFGHFAQGTGMRMTYLIRNINLWFARVVYERDALDEKLVQWSQETDFRIAIMLYIARFFVWVTRKILWALMIAGHFISSFMLRQMEYDADRYEARIVGSVTFAATLRRLRHLNAAQYSAGVYLGELWKDGRLVDNLPALIAARLEQLPVDFAAKDEELLRATKSGFLDTHPSDRDRIESTRHEQARGVFHLDVPAAALFQGLEEISEQATRAHYQQQLGAAFSSNNLISQAEFKRHEQEIDQGKEALSRYFQKVLSLWRPLIVAVHDLQTKANFSETVQNLKQARTEIIAQASHAVRAFASHEQAESQELRGLEASLLASLDIRNSKSVSNTPEASPIATQTEKEANTAIEALCRFENEARLRLLAALNLIHLPEFSANLAEAVAMREETTILLPALEKFGSIFEDLRQLRQEYMRMAFMLEHAKDIKNDRDTQHIINRVVASAHGLVRKIVGKLAEVDYPFEHAQGRLSLAQYALSEPSSADDFQKTFAATQELMDKLFSLYARILARLVMMAERAEAALGFELLPPPATPEQIEATEPLTTTN
ncbi:MAG: M48 family metalloprotease [bacterium]